jgi:putative ABC transport system permease protein
MTGLKAYGISMYAKNEAVTIKELNVALPEEYKNLLVATIDRDTLKMCLSILSGIFGGVGVAAALFILGVSIIVIRYLVRSLIDNEYHMIGIYKAMGRSNTEIKKIYFLSYMVTGLIGIVTGLILGRPLAIYFGNEILNNMKGLKLSYVTNLISLCVMFLMTALLAANIWLKLKKLNQITPVQAMTVGTKSTKRKICKSLIKDAHSAGVMAINRMFKERGMSLLIILVLTVSYYTCLMASAVGLSLGNYVNDREIWENLPDYDGYIKITNQENVINYLENSPFIKDYVEFTLSLDNVKMSFEDCDLTKNEANPMVYANFNSDRYKSVPFTQGRVCTNPHEIAASEQFIEKVGRSVGEYIKINIDGAEIDFLIVGSYSAMMRGGVSFYMQEQDLIEAGAKPDLSTVMFFLKDGINYEDFVDDFKAHYNDSKIYQDFNFIEQEGRTVNDIAVPICIVIFMAFAVFSILNIINVIYTQNRENRKKYGILKALGFTTGYICRGTIIQLTLESVVAIIFTVILHEGVSPILFSLACGIRYIYKPVWLTVIVCVGIYLSIMMITMIMLLPVRKITPVELMEE